MSNTNVLGFKTPVSSKQQVRNLKTSKAASLKEALRDVNEAKAIGREACTEIVVQGGAVFNISVIQTCSLDNDRPVVLPAEKLDHIEEDLDYIDGDLDYGDKLLNRIKNPLRYILGGSPTRAKQAKTNHHRAATDKPGQHAGTAAAAGHDQQTKAHDARTADLTISPEPLSDIDMLLLALGELEEQATAINTEAVKSTEQINRIGDKLTHVNDRVMAQTKTTNTAATKGSLW